MGKNDICDICNGTENSYSIPCYYKTYKIWLCFDCSIGLLCKLVKHYKIKPTADLKYYYNKFSLTEDYKKFVMDRRRIIKFNKL